MSIYEQNACMMHKHDVSQRKGRIDFHLAVPNNAFSQSDFNNHMFDTSMCFMADEKLIEAVCCFHCLWQVSSKSYKDARTRETAWTEVASPRN